MDEQRLIAGYKRGESWARREIYETFAPAMMSLCVRYVRNVDTAKDLLQDGFVKVFLSAEKYSEKGALGGWIRQIIVNTALEYLRRQNIIKWQELEENTDEADKTERFDMQKITANELMECVTSLPEVYRTVFNLVCIEGYSYNEIAIQLNTSEGVIRTQYHRARQKLQKIVWELITKDT
ncbi:MAG: sigma-70 family RNA polymerase sigma factor [Paludibacteraceae bacterium]